MLLVIGPAAALAQTRSELVRWQDPDNEGKGVIGYRIHWGESSRSYDQSLDVGIPAFVSDAFESTIEVAADAEVYIAITAYNATHESFHSNESCRAATGECTGGSVSDPTDSEPPPSGVQSQVLGFALWDAASDTVIDSDFQSGEIVLDGDDCFAIEIIGNGYLDDSGPGSIKRVFDGQDPGGCSEPGVSHENNAPFAWEVDEGPDAFACAATLTEVGAHTLTVTPYDGDDCTGNVGTAVTLDFEVIDGSAPPPPPPADEELGQPGKPVLAP